MHIEPEEPEDIGACPPQNAEPPCGDTKTLKIPLRRKLLIVVGLLLLALLISYGVGVYYWSHRFWPGSVLDGINLSEIAFADAPAMFVDDPDGAMLVIEDADTKTKDVITAEEIGFGTDYSTPLSEFEDEHNAWSWPMEVAMPKKCSRTAQSSYDEEKLAALVSDLDCMKAEPVKTEDAKLLYADGKFSIQDEVYGTEIKEEILKETILDAVASGEESIEVTEIPGVYIQPELTGNAPSLAEAKAKGDKMLQATQSWKADGNVEVISSGDIASWLSLDESGQPVLDHDAVASWWREIGKKYDRSAGSLHNFKTANGSVIDVSGGDWKGGGRATDESAMASASIESIESGEAETRDFIWAYGGDEYNGGIGGTYIEISIPDQHVWYYKNGKLAYDYACVTGKPDGRHNTPTGVYYIKDQATDYEMVGDDEDHDGKEDYRTTCKYWSRITWSGVGIHDLWHPSYGGSRYRSNGSHGCINSPLDAAKYIYENVAPNTPVVIY